MKKNVKRSSDKFALDEFITVFSAARIGQKKNRMSEDLRASLCKILISSFALKMDFAHIFSVDFF